MITRYRPATDAVAFSLMEYASLVLPIASYVLLEAINGKVEWFFFTSPEWGIATVFLAIHGPQLFEEEMRGSGIRLSAMRLRLIRNIGLVLAGAALLNSSLSFNQENSTKIGLRIAMFVLSTVTFFVCVGAAHYHHLAGRPSSTAGST